MKTFALRLHPDQDLRQSLKEFAMGHRLQAGCILSAIGSLKRAAIRFADRPTSEVLDAKFEILALNGTLSLHGIHLHIVLADQGGKTIGGHLDQGSLVYTTAEIVLGELPGVTFLRTLDAQTGYLELEIRED